AELASLIPRARLQTLPDVGHGGLWGDPETFNRACLDFLDGRGLHGLVCPDGAQPGKVTGNLHVRIRRGIIPTHFPQRGEGGSPGGRFPRDHRASRRRPGGARETGGPRLGRRSVVHEIGIGLLGVGTVGGGVLKIYGQHRADLEARAGCGLRIVAAVARDVAAPREGLEPGGWPLSSDPDRVLADPAVSLVVEGIGGLEPARTYVLRALETGKHVVTANKALLATHGTELFAAARRRGVLLGFEAAVAGGVPIIGALRDGLAANRILSLQGIVNGTSNFILTKMTDEGSDFAEALREAQAAGYAEADPTLDVEGIDSAHKLQILASLAFRTRVELKDIYTAGIARLEAIEIAYARDLGYRVKLLAIAKATDGALEARVHPTLIAATSPLAAVSGAFNAILVTGDAAGDQMFY